MAALRRDVIARCKRIDWAVLLRVIVTGIIFDGPSLDKLASDTALIEADVCVYGGTSGGVVAAVQVARVGKRVVLVDPGAGISAE